MVTDYFSDEEAMDAMSQEELGFSLLKLLAEGHHDSLLNSNNIVNPPSWEGLGVRVTPRFMDLVAEGWAWMVGEGHVAPRPGQGGDWFMLTRRAKVLARGVAIAR